MPLKPAPHSGTESVSGLIERVTFYNEENGFAVLKVQVKGRRELVTVIGNAASVNVGEWLVAEGTWVRDREHGTQLKASLLKVVPPNTIEGIEKFLGSGLIKGIGPVYAKKMVEKHGEQIFDIIENNSARLEEIDGIGPGRRRKIKAAWEEQKFTREIMVFLHSHGVSSSKAVRIFKTYGERAIEKIRANPYCLARDIPGIGFQSADKIARALGIAENSHLRVCAGLEHVLSEASGAGHSALPEEILVSKTSELLKVPPEKTSLALRDLVARLDLELEEIGGEPFVFLPWLRRAEESIARRLAAISANTASYPIKDVEAALAWVQKKNNLSLAPSQARALAQALQSKVIVITGGPGVGKTTLLNALLTILGAKKIKCLLCAPTGRAAKRLSEATGLEALTIHRLLGYQPGGKFARNEDTPLECDTLVVDECSMMDVPLTNALLRAVPSGSHLVLVGDVDQLPSVGPGSVLKDIIASHCVPVVRLTEVFRQAALSRIVSAAHAINQGELPETGSREDDSDFYFIPRESPEEILQTLREMVRERIPRKFRLNPKTEVQVLSPMNRGGLGIHELNAALQADLNPPKTNEITVDKFGWTYRIGDKVLQTENNYDKDVFNGDIGWIEKIDLTDQEIAVRFDDGRIVPYSFSELDELSPAFAMTIHKAQGSEFPAVVIPLAMQHYLLLQRNLLYTAVTRGRKLVVIIGQKKAFAHAIRTAESQQRYGGLLKRLEAVRTNAPSLDV